MRFPVRGTFTGQVATSSAVGLWLKFLEMRAGPSLWSTQRGTRSSRQCPDIANSRRAAATRSIHTTAEDQRYQYSEHGVFSLVPAGTQLSKSTPRPAASSLGARNEHPSDEDLLTHPPCPQSGTQSKKSGTAP